jgi:ribonuclease P protein component
MSPGKFPVSLRSSIKKSKDEPSLVLVVPKKAVKTAVARNLLRRRLRAILKEFLDPTQSLKVFASAGSDKLTFKELKEDLLKTKKHHEGNF